MLGHIYVHKFLETTGLIYFKFDETIGHIYVGCDFDNNQLSGFCTIKDLKWLKVGLCEWHTGLLHTHITWLCSTQMCVFIQTYIHSHMHI